MFTFTWDCIERGNFALLMLLFVVSNMFICIICMRRANRLSFCCMMNLWFSQVSADKHTRQKIVTQKKARTEIVKIDITIFSLVPCQSPRRSCRTRPEPQKQPQCTSPYARCDLMRKWVRIWDNCENLTQNKVGEAFGAHSAGHKMPLLRSITEASPYLQKKITGICNV